MKKYFNKIIFILTLVLLNSCQFNSLFHRTKKEENPNVNFKNLKSFSVNENYFTVAHDTIKKTLDIFKDTIKINNTYEIKPIDFISYSGNDLSALILNPKNNIREDLIFLHFHGNASNLLASHHSLISQLVKKGFQVLTFDYSGYGFSQGKATRRNALIDAYSALDFIKNSQELKNKKVIIFGQSYGGYLAYVVGSNRQNDIFGLIIEGAFYSHRKEAVHFAGFPANIVYDGIRAEKEIKKNTKPILIIHSNQDAIVPIKFAKKVFDTANEPKYFMEIDKPHLNGLLYYSENIKMKINEIFR